MKSNAFRILFFFLIPLFFIGISDKHDWGDDFAQYMMQARNLITGIPQIENGVKQDPGFGDFAVRAYPVGYPLILSPVVTTFELQIRPLLVLQTLLLFLSGLVLWPLMRRRVNAFLSLLIILLFIYHPLVLDLKSQVLSEISFVLFLYLLLHKLEKEINFRNTVSCGLLLGFLCSIRIIGILSVPAILLYFLFGKPETGYHTLSRWNRSLHALTCMGAGILFFLVLNGVLFPIPLDGLLDFYVQAFQHHAADLPAQAGNYFQALSALFPVPGLPDQVRALLFLVLLTGGWLFSFRLRPGPDVFLLPCYLSGLLFYPYSGGILRFLIPVLPLILLYSLGIFSFGQRIFRLKNDLIPALLLCIVLLTGYVPRLMEIKTGKVVQIPGPQDKSSEELFNYIHNFISKESVLVFPRARAMALYGERKTTYLLERIPDDQNKEMFDQMGVDYLILPEGGASNPVYSARLDGFRKKYASNTEKVWSNEDFSVYSYR